MPRLSMRPIIWALGWAVTGLGTCHPVVSQTTPETTETQTTATEPEDIEMTPDDSARDLVHYYENHVRPFEIEANVAWWEANVTGDEASFQKKQAAEDELNEMLANEFRFKQLQELRETELSDPLLARQVRLLYLKYLAKQIDVDLMKRMTAISNEIERTFNVFRARVGEKNLTDSEVRKVLKESTDTAERKAVWEASKGVGAEIETKIKELVLMRNEAAKKLGFPNYHAMMLTLSEQTPEGILKLFDELDALTREPYQRAKADIDMRLAAKYRV
ncbi:MAG TPA: M2 family metallopeptidase, partial [Pirellulaceae bacterium]